MAEDINDEEVLRESVVGRRFWIRDVSTPNREAFDLFAAIQEAYLPNGAGKYAPFDKELVQYLAACSSVALQYDRDQKIPWDRSDHDYVIDLLWRRFAGVLREAIQSGNYITDERRVLVGCFTVPNEFMEHVRASSEKG